MLHPRLTAIACCWVALIVAGCGQSQPAVPAVGGLYASLGCARCHGEAGEGTRTAPPVRSMQRFWDQDGLVELLQDPTGTVARSPRLMVASERYAIKMAPVQADEETLRALARQLLSLDEKTGASTAEPAAGQGEPG